MAPKPLIKDTHPEMIAQFPQELNLDIDINKVTEGSGKKITWKCTEDEKHLWVAKPNNRVYYKSFGCPHCRGSAGNSTLPGKDEQTEKENGRLLFIANPTLFSEIDSTKNPDINITKLTYGSNKKVRWTCNECKHDWITQPQYRTRKDSGCPECAKKLKGNGTSQLEQSFFNEFNNNPLFIGTSNGSRTGVFFESGRECTVDIISTYIKDDKLRMVFFELDGEYWHKNKVEVDEQKTNLLLAKYPLALIVRVRTGELPFLEIESENLLQLRLNKTGQADIEGVINEIVKKLSQD